MIETQFWEHVVIDRGVTRTLALIHANCFPIVPDSSSTTQTSSKSTAPSQSKSQALTITSKTCTPGDQGCITIKFHEARSMCRTSDVTSKGRLDVLADGFCNHISTAKGSYYYRLSCGGNGVTVNLYCNKSCKRCKVNEMVAVLDGECATIPEFIMRPEFSLDSIDQKQQYTDADVTFNGMCEIPQPTMIAQPIKIPQTTTPECS